MHKMRVAACLALLAALAGVRAANAGALEEGAERYRPYLIEGVASALAGARALRERAAAADLPGAKKAVACRHAPAGSARRCSPRASSPSSMPRSMPGRTPIAASTPSRRNCSAQAAPTSPPMRRGSSNT